LGKKQVNRWGKTKSASFYPQKLFTVGKKNLLRVQKEPYLDLPQGLMSFYPQDDWSLFTPRLVSFYPKIGLFLPQRSRFSKFE